MAKRREPVKAWGGFVDGQLHRFTNPINGETGIAVYWARAKARADYYQDVRRVEIREVPKRKAGK